MASVESFGGCVLETIWAVGAGVLAAQNHRACDPLQSGNVLVLPGPYRVATSLAKRPYRLSTG